MNAPTQNMACCLLEPVESVAVGSKFFGHFIFGRYPALQGKWL